MNRIARILAPVTIAAAAFGLSACADTRADDTSMAGSSAAAQAAASAQQAEAAAQRAEQAAARAEAAAEQASRAFNTGLAK